LDLPAGSRAIQVRFMVLDYFELFGQPHSLVSGAGPYIDRVRIGRVGGTPSDVVVAPPARTVLHQNVPNPFNPSTQIRFDLQRSTHVQLRVFDVAGRHVRTLVDADLEAGLGHGARWDGTDDAGVRMPSGVYLVRLTTPDISTARRLVLIE
jgi:hypothetical protein